MRSPLYSMYVKLVKLIIQKHSVELGIGCGQCLRGTFPQLTPKFGDDRLTLRCLNEQYKMAPIYYV